jgi:hypothetical protein
MTPVHAVFVFCSGPCMILVIHIVMMTSRLAQRRARRPATSAPARDCARQFVAAPHPFAAGQRVSCTSTRPTSIAAPASQFRLPFVSRSNPNGLARPVAARDVVREGPGSKSSSIRSLASRAASSRAVRASDRKERFSATVTSDQTMLVGT